jgi:hypothetical protein
MPQKFQTERRYVNTLLKLLFCNHALRRFDKVRSERAHDNLIILWADEAQRFMTASEEGTSDYNCVDVIREAGATIVAAAQSTTSLIPPLGKDKSRVLTLNLRNRMIFRSADEAEALQAADFLARNESSIAPVTPLAKTPSLMRKPRAQNQAAPAPHSARPRGVLVHCENRFRNCSAATWPNGKVSSWFAKLVVLNEQSSLLPTRVPWKDFEVIIHSSILKLKSTLAYSAAKGEDRAPADRGCAGEGAKHGLSIDFVVPVIQVDDGHYNALPVAFAAVLARHLGAKLWLDVCQINKVNHTEAHAL